MNQKVDQKLLDAAKKEAEKLKNKSKTGVTSSSIELIEKIKGVLSDEDAKKILDMLPIDIDPGVAPTRTKGPRDVKGMKEGGMVVKDKTVAMDKSPNSGLITQRGFGARRRT